MKRDILDKLTIVANWLALIVVPIVIAGSTLIYQDNQAEESERRLWVQIGIDILRDVDAKPELRAWALAVINDHSSISIEQESASKFRSGEWTIPKGIAEGLMWLPIQNYLPKGEQ